MNAKQQKIKEIERVMFVICSKRGEIQTYTLHEYRKGSINALLRGTNLKWEDVKHIWNVKKVDVTIKDWSNESGWK